MEQQTSFRKKDLIISLVIGEICAWLVLAIAKDAFPPGVYEKYSQLLLYALPVFFPLVCLIGLYLAHIISKKIAIIYQIAKFVLVGGFNTLVDWGVLAVISGLALSQYTIAPTDVMFGVFSKTVTFFALFKGISFIIASTNSYPWNKFWTFKRKTDEKVGKEFLQFLVISLIGLFVNVAIAALVFQQFVNSGSLTEGQWKIIAAAVATVVSMSWNFIGYKFIVFEQKKTAPEAQAVSQPQPQPTSQPRKII